MYYIVFIFLFLGSLIEILSRRKTKAFFYCAFFLMTLMTCLRYGQSTDYFNYKNAYLNPEESRNPDLLYTFLQVLCRNIGFSYEGLVFVCGLIVMGFMYPFLGKKASYSSLALLIFYSIFFLVYDMSAIRQGIALSLLLWAFMYLERGKTISFVAIVIVGSLFHFSVISALLILFIYNKHYFNNSYVIWILIGMTFYSAFVPDLSWLFQLYFPDRAVDGGFHDTRWPALIVRVLYIIPVYLIKPPYGSVGYNARAICLAGYCFYCFLSFDSLTAGRIETYFRVFFSLFCAYVVFSMRRTRMRIFCLLYILVLQSALFFKNVDTMRDQADYKDHITMFNFPFISVFEESQFENYSDMVDKNN